jgi:hypothetical protein
MPFPPAQPMTAFVSHTSSRILLTEQGIGDGLLGMTGDVTREHAPHRWADRLEALHKVEGNEQPATRRRGGRDSDQNNSAGDVDHGEADHAEYGLLCLGSEPAEHVRPKLCWIEEELTR